MLNCGGGDTDGNVGKGTCEGIIDLVGDGGDNGENVPSLMVFPCGDVTGEREGDFDRGGEGSELLDSGDGEIPGAGDSDSEGYSSSYRAVSESDASVDIDASLRLDFKSCDPDLPKLPLPLLFVLLRR